MNTQCASHHVVSNPRVAALLRDTNFVLPGGPKPCPGEQPMAHLSKPRPELLTT
ncbi:hypothetical protein [Flexivirga caeni]|uniref:hypothetical protein n=1 Tax=Flexivirga caeni TaxID=2294115 RepID=UPI0013155BD1|nr:hypothetical protein [Flexivirga caeni]